MNEEFTRMIHGCGKQMEPVAVNVYGNTVVPGWRCPDHPEDEYVQDYIWDSITTYTDGTAGVHVPYSSISTGVSA